MRNKHLPARVVSPGRIIARELEARGWTQRDLATVMGRPYQAINEIIKGAKQITPDTARELSMAFGTSMDFWMNLEANYRLFLAAQEDKEKEIERRSQIYTAAPVSELTKRGWIQGSDDTGELEDQVCSFLEISSIRETPAAYASLRISESRGPEESAKVAWIKRVEQLARQQLVDTYDPDRLRSQIPQILTLAEKAEDAARVPDAFRNLGVHFLIVPHLPHTYLDGATLYIDRHPVIAITLRYDRIDCFWFTVLHELAHLVSGHPAQLDSLFGEEEQETNEKNQAAESEANDLAQDWLIDQAAMDQFIEKVQPFSSKTKITRFAAEQKRHPGIILGQLQYRGVVQFKNLRSLLVKVRPYLERWIDKPLPG